jgi:TonB family protein
LGIEEIDVKSRLFVAWASLSMASTIAAAPTRDVVAVDKINDFLLKNYPSDALKARAQGTVEFQISIGPDGMPTSCVVTKGSGVRSLDDATCSLLTLHATFVPTRASVTTTGRINWRLPDGATQMASVSTKPQSADRTVCKVTDNTGSLIPVRVCKLASEWGEIERESKGSFEQSQGRGYSCGGEGVCPDMVSTGPGH